MDGWVGGWVGEWVGMLVGGGMGVEGLWGGGGAEWGRGRGRGRQQSTINFIQNIESLSSNCCTPRPELPHNLQHSPTPAHNHGLSGSGGTRRGLDREKIDIEC